MSRKSARPPRPVRGLTLAALGALVLIVLVVFWPTFQSGFVYDSQGEIVAWDWLHDSRNILTAVSFRVMSLDVLDFNRPVAVAWLMFNAMLWGRDPVGYHVMSVVLHAACVCLAFLLIRQVLAQGSRARDPSPRNFAAFLGTLLFALHPVVTEAVCEPSNCKDLLATLFILTGLLVAARHRPGPLGPGDPARLLLVPLLCLLSIGAKELGVAFTVVLLAWWFLFRRREPSTFWLTAILASGAVTLLFLVARFALAHHPSEIFLFEPDYPGRTLLDTLFLIQPRIFALYLYNLVWPCYLCADYTGYSVSFLGLGLSYPLLVLVATALAWWSWHDRRALFATVFLAATLLPVSNLVPIYHAAADRFLYAPLISLAVLLALALESPWLARRAFRRELAIWGTVGLLGLLVPLTLQREGVWSSEVALWQDTLAKNPFSLPARTNLPEALLDVGLIQEARVQSEATIKTPFASWPWVWFDYAIELERLGDSTGAEKAARHAIQLKPDILDTEKMARTLQSPRDRSLEFDRIAARLSLPTP